MVGDVIRARRLELGMKQQTLADLTHMRQSAISDIEHGTRTNLTLEVLQRFAVALRIPLADLAAAQSGPAVPLRDDEALLLAIMDQLDPQDRPLLVRLAEGLLRVGEAAQRGAAEDRALLQQEQEAGEARRGARHGKASA